MQESNKPIWDDEKGLFIPGNLIKYFGIRKSIKIASVLSNSPEVKKSDIREVKKILKINIKNIKPKDIINFLKNNKGNKICSLCKTRCFCLHKHHYPIPKKNGGKKTINICGKCHVDFHFIEDNKYLIFNK